MDAELALAGEAECQASAPHELRPSLGVVKPPGEMQQFVEAEEGQDADQHGDRASGLIARQVCECDDEWTTNPESGSYGIEP